VPYLSALEVRSRRGAIKINVYLYLYLGICIPTNVYSTTLVNCVLDLTLLRYFRNIFWILSVVCLAKKREQMRFLLDVNVSRNFNVRISVR